MNLNENPSPNELREMLGKLDDDVAAHIPWVDHDGSVHIDPFPEHLTPREFAEKNDHVIKFRFETCQRGNL